MGGNEGETLNILDSNSSILNRVVAIGKKREKGKAKSKTGAVKCLRRTFILYNRKDYLKTNQSFHGTVIAIKGLINLSYFINRQG